MSLTTPSEGPTLLVAAARTDHDRLLELLREADVHTSTPGVSRDIRRQLTEAISAHVNAETEVAHGAIRDALGVDAYDEAEADAARLRLLALAITDHPTDAWVDELRQGLEDHRHVMEDGLLPRLAAREPEHAATLGFRFSDAMERVSRRPAG